MPRLVSRWASIPVLSTEEGAAYYRLIGLEITATPEATLVYSLVTLGHGGAEQNTLAKQPHHLVLDRLYVHGTPTLPLQRCIGLNSATTAIVDSWISECHMRGFDTQAIAGWNGTGPYKIENNYLEAAGENLLFGGADPAIPDAVPADIEIRRNHLYKPVAWQGVWSVKNLFELKLGQRVLVEGNVLENNWSDGQDGFAIVWKSANETGGAPWAITSDVTFRYNLVRNSPGGINLAGDPGLYPGRPATRFHIAHNVFEQIGTFAGTRNERLFQLLSHSVPERQLADVVLEHNTALHNTAGGQSIMFDGGPIHRLAVRNNIFTRGEYGVFGGGSSEGTYSLTRYAPGAVFTGNVLVAAPSALYPAGNAFPSTLGGVGFLNPAAGDYRLATSSQYPGKGADAAAVATATSGVRR
jgi:hypothetical protein